MLVLAFFKDQVMLLSCTTSHIYIQIRENKNVLLTRSKNHLLLHVQQSVQLGFLKKSFICPKKKNPKQFRVTKGPPS